LAALALFYLFYLFYDVRPTTLETLLEPLDDRLQRYFDTWLPNPEVFFWLRAGLYTAAALGVSYILSLLVTQLGWLLPLERFSFLLAVLLALVAAFLWGALGGAVWGVLGGAAVAVLILCLCDIVRLTR